MKASEFPVLQKFENYVDLKFQIYNSLFTNLPFYKIEKTGILLSLFSSLCKEGYEVRKGPIQIVQEFFQNQPAYTNEKEKNDLFFRFVQFIERQVVLFDAVEDAAFNKINDLGGSGTLKDLIEQVSQSGLEKDLQEKLKTFAILITLTAHPTQFYPREVLRIIWDLSLALRNNNTPLINLYLKQLGKTPFLKKDKPTPLTEAKNLIWYLENVFYDALGGIVTDLKKAFPEAVAEDNPILQMGFWPGGDRDGNPYVLYETTLEVANELRIRILKCYYNQLKYMKRRLTFRGIRHLVSELQHLLYENIFIHPKEPNITKESILNILNEMKQTLIEKHKSLFLDLVEDLITKVEIFGVHFTRLDIRQDSSIHIKLFQELHKKGILPEDYYDKTDNEKIEWLLDNAKPIGDIDFGDDVLNDVFGSMRAMKAIQEMNGAAGCNRHVISHSTSALDMIRVYALFRMSGWKEEDMNVDIVPLIETVEDLHNARSIMEDMYTNKRYMEHLKKRSMTQTIMLGFSDGSKDGGYLMGNWSIYQAKETLTEVSEKYGISVIFFDGRGGPAARGGGKTHRFFASMANNISNREFQLTIQGQTVSSNFGMVESARYNFEQLLHAGIATSVIHPKEKTFTALQEELMEQLAEDSFVVYTALKDHPKFMDYLLDISPLRYYSDTNIGSRPTKRGKGKMNFEDLRAIPFAASWSQLKSNVTGFVGVGTALKKAEEKGNFDAVKKLYKESLFFRTLIDNCEMAMKKSFLPLTSYLAKDEEFGGLWNFINEEFNLTKEYLKKMTGHELMEDYPIERISIDLREEITLPLLTIQQYAMSKIRRLEKENASPEEKKVYEKMVLRCSFGIINAGRNSA